MLLYGIAAVTVLWFLVSNFAHANPASLAKLLKVIGGIVALGIAGLLAIRGRIDIALLIGSLGAWLLGWSRLAFPNLGRRAQPASGSTSRVRSRLLLTLCVFTPMRKATVEVSLEKADTIRIAGLALRQQLPQACLVQ